MDESASLLDKETFCKLVENVSSLEMNAYPCPFFENSENDDYYSSDEESCDTFWEENLKIERLTEVILDCSGGMKPNISFLNNFPTIGIKECDTRLDLSILTNVEDLTLTYCKETEVIMCLPNLKRLNLKGNCHLKLIENLPNLEKYSCKRFNWNPEIEIINCPLLISNEQSII